MRCLAALALVIPVCAQGIAVASVSEQLLEDQLSVRELMRLEAAQTAQSINHASPDATLPRHDAVAARQQGKEADDAVILLGIYGHGRRLTAQMLIGGRHHLYRQGHAQPLARARTRMNGKEAEPAHGYTLLGISASCVELERAGDPLTLCLHPRLPIRTGSFPAEPSSTAEAGLSR